MKPSQLGACITAGIWQVVSVARAVERSTVTVAEDAAHCGACSEPCKLVNVIYGSWSITFFAGCTYHRRIATDRMT